MKELIQTIQDACNEYLTTHSFNQRLRRAVSSSAFHPEYPKVTELECLIAKPDGGDGYELVFRQTIQADDVDPVVIEVIHNPSYGDLLLADTYDLFVDHAWTTSSVNEPPLFEWLKEIEYREFVVDFVWEDVYAWFADVQRERVAYLETHMPSLGAGSPTIRVTGVNQGEVVYKSGLTFLIADLKGSEQKVKRLLLEKGLRS